LLAILIRIKVQCHWSLSHRIYTIISNSWSIWFDYLCIYI
jgi:hypothetical protein